MAGIYSYYHQPSLGTDESEVHHDYQPHITSRVLENSIHQHNSRGGLGSDPITLADQNNSTISQSTISHTGSDFVVYGRVPPWPHTISLHGEEDEDAHDVDRETFDMSSDSDDDPFKYDRESFTVFLQPSREREVSAALRCVSADSTASISGIAPYAPLQQQNNTPCVGQTTNPFTNRLRCYQTSNVEYDWESGGTSNEVRISIRPLTAPPNSPIVLTSRIEDHAERPGGGDGKKEISALMSDGADWETVATSVGQFDSNRALASSNGLSGSHLVKVTGSSIADYSDTSSVHVPHFDAFSSTERILPRKSSEHMNMADNTSERSVFPGGKKPVFRTPPRLIARVRRNTSHSATVMRNMPTDLHHIGITTEATRGHPGTNSTLRSGHYPAPGRGIGGDDCFFPTDSVNEEAYLSWEARRRRRGAFDSALSWYTRGETGSLTRQQRRNVLLVGIVFAGLWLVVLAVFVTIVVARRVGE
ncbi:hypothetical protein VTH82DRAFT_3693 [Thermothelomyces myriococcoides]